MAENQETVETLAPAPEKKHNKVYAAFLRLPKSKRATIVMFACIILFVALFIILYVVGGGVKGQWNTARVDLAEYKLFEPDKVAEAQARVDGLTAGYRVCSIGSYICSILALASLGIGLAKADKYKTQEEEAAEAM